MEKKIGIYQILNCVNNKCYVGSSLNLRKRCQDHKRLLNLGKHDNCHLQSAWNKYGEENFKFKILEVLENLETDDYYEINKILRDKETSYIEKYKSSDSNFGYNFIPGGIGTYGLSCSEEKKKKISEANKGRTASNLGQPMSEEQKELLRKIDGEKYGKAIDVYTINKIFLETLPSIREVHRKYGSARNTIKECCDNLREPINLIFRYHGDSLDTIGSAKPKKSKEELEQQAIKYRQSKGKAVDVYNYDGTFVKTCPAIVAVSEEFNLSESTVRNGLKTKKIIGNLFVRYAGEELGDIKMYINTRCTKGTKNFPLCYNIYDNKSKKLIESCKYKKDMEKYAYPREKNKLQQLLNEYSNYQDSFVYHNYYIEYNFAPIISNDNNESRQLNNSEGTNNSANGEA